MTSLDVVEERNAAYIAWRQKMATAIKNLSDDELQSIVRAFTESGRTLAEIARQNQTKLAIDWDSVDDKVVGLMIYQHALEKLDLYDDDLRPRDP